MAALTLTAIPFDGDPLFSGTASINGERYTIGRAADNDWVLADAKRLVSKNHCAIERIADGFRVVDRSTNGMRVNERALTRGDTARLSSGDEIALGGYVFRVALSQTGRLPNVGRTDMDIGLGLGPLGAATSVSSILEDVAQDGAGDTGALMPDARPDAFGDRVRPGAGDTLGAMGWDGPPETEIDLTEGEAPPAATAFSDASQQVGPDRQLIDLPKADVAKPAADKVAPPATIIPDDWLDAAPATPSVTPEPATPEPIASSARAHVIPVENLDLSEPATQPAIVTVPAPAPTPITPAPVAAPPPTNEDRTGELIEALCDGLGVDPALLVDLADDPGDAVRLMHNAGLALRQASQALIANTEAVAKANTAFDASAAPERTPWVFAMAGSDRTRMMDNIAVFLGEAEPRDLTAMREDEEAVTRFVEAMPASVIAFTERFQNAMPGGRTGLHGAGQDRPLGHVQRRALGLPDEPESARAHLLDLLTVQSRAGSR